MQHWAPKKAVRQVFSSGSWKRVREVCFSYIFKLEMEIYLYILLSNSVRGNLLEFHLALDLEFQILCEFGHTRSAVSEHRSWVGSRQWDGTAFLSWCSFRSLSVYGLSWCMWLTLRFILWRQCFVRKYSSMSKCSWQNVLVPRTYSDFYRIKSITTILKELTAAAIP